MERTFPQILSEYQKKITQELEKFFNRKIKQTKEVGAKKTLRLLKEFSLRPAKRLRAILVNYGYFLAGGKNRKTILETSIFIELIHNFLLIHDDIIDQDELRRGRPSLHYQYKKLSSFKAEKNKNFGQSMAMIAGDLINVLGYEILTNSEFPANLKIQALEKLNQIIIKTCQGQMLEMLLKQKLVNNKKVTEKDILKIYQLKTAYYSFFGPLQIGAILAGANKKFLEKLKNYALPLGIAFQIQDDLTEIFGSKKEIGKPLCSDIREGQPNLLIIKTLEKIKIFRKYLGKTKINKNEIRKIKEIIRKAGVLEYCQKKSEKLISHSKKTINLRIFPKKEKQFLLDLIEYIVKRY